MNLEIFSAKNLKVVTFFMAFIAILALIFSLLQQPKYESNVKLITIFSQDNMDPYTAGRNASYITGVLGEIIYSNSFIDNVYGSDLGVIDNLGSDPETRQKNWKKMVQIKTKDTQGIMYVSVFHPDRNQAKQLAQAIAYTMIDKHSQYDGSGNKVTIKIIDNPITSTDYAQPNTIQNVLLGLITGAMAGFALVVIFPNHKLFEGRKRRDEMISLAPAADHYAPNFYQFNLQSTEAAKAKAVDTNFNL